MPGFPVWLWHSSVQCCAEGSVREFGEQVQSGDCRCAVPPSLSLLPCPSIPGEMTLLWQCWGDRGAGLEGCVGLTFLALWFPKPLLCCPSTKQEASKLFAKTRLIKPRQGNGCLLFLMYPKDPHALLETNLQYFILHMSLSLFNPLNN